MRFRGARHTIDGIVAWFDGDEIMTPFEEAVDAGLPYLRWDYMEKEFREYRDFSDNKDSDSMVARDYKLNIKDLGVDGYLRTKALFIELCYIPYPDTNRKTHRKAEKILDLSRNWLDKYDYTVENISIADILIYLAIERRNLGGSFELWMQHFVRELGIWNYFWDLKSGKDVDFLTPIHRFMEN